MSILTPSYAKYHAECWAEERTKGEIRDEINRLEASIYRTREWNGVGNATCDSVRIDTLYNILKQ